MKQVTIHEFSTGIKAKIASDGSWVSHGWTAEYLNITLSSIPQGVRRAIANELFAVVEGKATENPVIIGREVFDPEEKKWWCVVALINKGRDNKGRPLSVTRYFLTEGKGNLWKILAWMEQVKQRTGKLPIFNPNDRKSVGNPLTVNVDYPHTKTLPDNIRNNQVVFLRDEYTLQDINHYVQQKTEGIVSVSWAVNIEALQRPESFTLIQAANIEALKRIKKKIINSQTSHPETFDQRKIELYISTIIGRDAVNINALRILANAFEEENVSEQIWDNLFNGEGADKAITMNVYSPRMARLLSLRIFAPFEEEQRDEYITELIEWLRLTPTLKPVCDNTIRNFVEHHPHPDSMETIIKQTLKFRFYQLYKNRCKYQDIIALLALGGEDGPWNKHLQKPYNNHLIYQILSQWEPIKKGSNWKKDIFNDNPDDITIWEPLIEYIIRHRPQHSIKTKNKSLSKFTRFSDKIKQGVKKIFLPKLVDGMPDENELKQGIDAIDKTKKSLADLAEEIYNEIQGDNSAYGELSLKREVVQKQIAETIISYESNIVFNTLKKTNKPSIKAKINEFYKFIFQDKSKDDKDDYQKKKQLVNAIYSYQKKHGFSANGILGKNNIDKGENNEENNGDRTLQKIKDDVISKLREDHGIFPSEMPEAIKYFEKTENSLNKLIENINSKNSNTEVEKKEACRRIFLELSQYIPENIKSQINLEVEIIIDQVDNEDDTIKKNLIKSIAFYQFKHNIKDEKYGILQTENKTYNKLLKEMKPNEELLDEMKHN